MLSEIAFGSVVNTKPGRLLLRAVSGSIGLTYDK